MARTAGNLMCGLVGLDIAGHDDESEKGAEKEAGDLEHGEECGAPCAGVVDEDPLWQFWRRQSAIGSTSTRQSPISS